MTFNAGIEAAALNRADEPIGHLARTVGDKLTYVSNEDAKFYSTAFPVYTRPSSSAPVERREAVARALCCPRGCQNPDKCFSLSVQMLCHTGGQIDAILSLPGSSRDEVKP